MKYLSRQCYYKRIPLQNSFVYTLDYIGKRRKHYLFPKISLKSLLGSVGVFLNQSPLTQKIKRLSWPNIPIP